MKATYTVYPFFDIQMFRTELALSYDMKELRTLLDALFIRFHTKFNACLAFNEYEKCPTIIIIPIPMTSSEAEVCFSTLKCVKNIFYGTPCLRYGFTGLAVLPVERDFFTGI